MKVIDNILSLVCFGRFVLVTILITLCDYAYSQPELMSWGNMDGIRVEGQLMGFHSSLVVVSEDWSRVIQSYKERQRPKYWREGDRQIVESTLGNLDFREVVKETGRGAANVKIDFTPKSDTTIAGAFFKVELPADCYLDGTLEFNDEHIPLTLSEFDVENHYKAFKSGNAVFKGSEKKMEMDFDQEINFYVSVFEDGDQKKIEIYIPVIEGYAQKDKVKSRTIDITVGGEINREPVTLPVESGNPGRSFDGIGGNFRLQNPAVDPKVIQYCLDNLNVTWARVELPWRFWQPDENTDPLEEARKGNVHERVKAAMEMAKKVYDMGIPVVLADWSAPDWAVTGEYSSRPRPGGEWGNPLDQSKSEKIYQSLTSYLIYLKEVYGVEAEMFSFNESDLGINVRQTDEEHTKLIKELGAYFKSHRLKTKMLLGDTADANGFAFVDNATEDPGARPYVGAVSFHSWRGWENETLERWNEAAKKMGVPLLVAEGSIDASAWRVPAIFEESSYALMEIDLYVRILNICQPRSILQWQLTSDYSVLAGGGVFGNDSVPLHPTRRFWNLKQLGLTPVGLQIFETHCDHQDVSYAVLGDLSAGKCAIHLVNNAAARMVRITGLPANMDQFEIYVTGPENQMKRVQQVVAHNGELTFKAEAVSFISLIKK